MDTVALKSTLHLLIEQINDNDVLQAYTTLLSREAAHQGDFWDALTPTQQAQIDRGITDLAAGRRKLLENKDDFSNKELMKTFSAEFDIYEE